MSFNYRSLREVLSSLEGGESTIYFRTRKSGPDYGWLAACFELGNEAIWILGQAVVCTSTDFGNRVFLD